ncbi:MAG TPA: isochorismatase [Thermoanaerobaculia bacterium]|nr:isochorismatase [Thermoanaerobaculia bacterium]
MSALRQLPLPAHFEPARVGEVWRVPYQERARQAEEWAVRRAIRPASEDGFRIALLAVDVQNTFCIPGFELYVGGRSGMGAIDDNRRLCEFLYRNLEAVTEIALTLDTHEAIQIFHSVFLTDPEGRHPEPLTRVSPEDIARGRWRVSSTAAGALGLAAEEGERYLRHYTRTLAEHGKYELTIWPYHAMLGGIGHALVSAVEEAVFFHTVARGRRPDFEVKGRNPLTEHYSVFGPEVREGPGGELIDRKNEGLLRRLADFDAVVIAGQAKSHCVAWTIDDLLVEVRAIDERLVRKVYLLEDCTSPVVVPGIIDYTEEADAAFRRFADAGMHVVRSTDPIESWPDMRL